MKYNLQENIGKQIEVFTKLRDLIKIDENGNPVWSDWYTKSTHKGIICKDENGFYCQCDTYRFPLYEDTSFSERFGVSIKYVITL